MSVGMGLRLPLQLGCIYESDFLSQATLVWRPTSGPATSTKLGLSWLWRWEEIIF